MIYWDCIDQKTAQLLKRFKNTSLMKEFYLSGGTALALQLGRRISVDLEDKDVVVRQLHGSYDFDNLMEELRSATGGEGERIFTSAPSALNDSVANRSRERTCSVRCQTSKAPVSTCRCVCGGMNHGSRSNS